MKKDQIRDTVKEKYGKVAIKVITGKEGQAEASSCCSSVLDPAKLDPIISNLYTDRETDGLPAEALAASLGCGNPTALAELRPGEVVLDLGSGGGGARLQIAIRDASRGCRTTGRSRRRGRGPPVLGLSARPCAFRPALHALLPFRDIPAGAAEIFLQ